MALRRLLTSVCSQVASSRARSVTLCTTRTDDHPQAATGSISSRSDGARDLQMLLPARRSALRAGQTRKVAERPGPSNLCVV
ncbi:hypothetical protein C8Q76DRAFT_746750 [Earliella scabrosa]|nr:hypothetical protein C8Q76DRAFT_746750 [Earliella scabrosa]